MDGDLFALDISSHILMNKKYPKQERRKIRFTNEEVPIIYTFCPLCRSLTNICVKIVVLQILKTSYQSHRRLLCFRRVHSPYKSDISVACKKYITLTAKIQDNKP